MTGFIRSSPDPFMEAPLFGLESPVLGLEPPLFCLVLTLLGLAPQLFGRGTPGAIYLFLVYFWFLFLLLFAFLDTVNVLGGFRTTIVQTRF